MSSVINAILNNVMDTIREYSEIENVSVNSAIFDNSIPYAKVELEDIKYFTADDSLHNKWGRAEISIEVSSSSNCELEGYLRLTEICESVTDALLDDSTRDGNCVDLPIGKATEISTITRPGNSNSSNWFKICINCHFELSKTDQGE